MASLCLEANRGWDKTYCLRHLESEAKKEGGVTYNKIHFFGNKAFEALRGAMTGKSTAIRARLDML
ncbi:hypothetical protein E4U14_005976 [Claviceps sp. LM454 group G7]|nr:hypothetical protein E4U14_005976 [Claviceps sp. LM454 group G7]